MHSDTGEGEITMIRTMKGTDIEEIIKVWNRAMPHHAIDNRGFVKNILLDMNFDQKGFFVAENDGEIVGFIQAIIRKVPIDVGGGMDEDKAYINLIGLKYEEDVLGGLGMALIRQAESYIKSFGERTIYVSEYTPNFIYQGIRVDYTDYMQLFRDAGYREGKTNQAIAVDLLSFRGSEENDALRKKREEEGFLFTGLEDAYIPSLLQYERPGWIHRYRRIIQETMDYEKVRLVIYKGEVIGCALFGDPYSCEERFGPFSVSDQFRGLGLGKILLDDCLWTMKKRGLQNAWAQSTPMGSAAFYVYAKAGFKPTGVYTSFVK